MNVKILIPTSLQRYTNNQATLEYSVDTIDKLISNIETNFPEIKSHLTDDTGKLHRFLNFYLNNEDIRFLDNTKTKLKDGDEVSIISAIAGG
ncbi:MAG: molybdopterin synthase subunit MoaD [Candidatus Atelocyanobacterium thalassa isolate SIO64986]|uniref:Molybdopterin synthase subunit MoaD n=1 Tax=Candidatus Atelocyanobacterium thalassa isolate SIO64986 TaxID=1527444 RepID=A0A086CHE3_9CHRO|nr:MAG: molybdopterin synthase subunit MoaD [Candidatus Atelocyanobacterium thalassa isolate SIO64986]